MKTHRMRAELFIVLTTNRFLNAAYTPIYEFFLFESNLFAYLRSFKLLVHIDPSIVNSTRLIEGLSFGHLNLKFLISILCLHLITLISV